MDKKESEKERERARAKREKEEEKRMNERCCYSHLDRRLFFFLSRYEKVFMLKNKKYIWF